MHTIGDLFVPFSMQQVYKREALAKGTADRLVQRAIRDVGHCAFTPQETVTRVRRPRHLGRGGHQAGR